MKFETAKKVFSQLNQNHVRYIVVGGVAVNAHGYMRLTADVDLVIWLESENVIRAFRALKEAGYLPQQPIKPEDFGNESIREKWRAEKKLVVLKMWSDQDPETVIDIFVYEPFDFKEEYTRAKIEILKDCGEVRIVSLGTLIEMKREAAREKDLSDISNLKKLYKL